MGKKKSVRRSDSAKSTKVSDLPPKSDKTSQVKGGGNYTIGTPPAPHHG